MIKYQIFLGSLDKAIRTSKDGTSGAKFVNQDVPLYLGCPCRGSGSRPLVAQLMRIHVVTPKAPVKGSNLFIFYVQIFYMKKS